MVRFSRKNLIVVAVVLVAVAAAGATVYGSERIRCAVGLLCERTSATGAENQFAATTNNLVATSTATTTNLGSNPDTLSGADASPALSVPTPAPAYFPPVVATPILAQPTPTSNPVVIAPEGSTTFSVSAVPLLMGGNVHAGESVPVSYLMVVNRGTYAARLTGFWVQQNSNAPTATVIGLSTVDDKGGSRAQTGGAEGSAPFTNYVALAPTNVLFQPGQLKLFTIKAIMSSDISASYGTELKIDVTGIRAEQVTTTGSFPIRGTTWILAP